MMRGERGYVCAKNGEQRIYFSPRWSRPAAQRRVSWILPAYMRAVFLKKSFIIGISLSLTVYPIAPVLVIADDTSVESGAVSGSVYPETEETFAEGSAEGESVSEESIPTKGSVTPEVVPTALENPVPEESVTRETSPCDKISGDGHEGSDVRNCNDSEADNDAATVSDTGDNTIAADRDAIADEPAVPDGSEAVPGDGTTIDTGDADATAASVNDVNTNIVGTDVAKEVVVKDGSDDGDIDLLEAFVGTRAENGDNPKSVSPDGSGTGATVVNGNEAALENTVAAQADTGDNAIEGGGDAAVGTGDATAVASVVNIVNTTLVGSNGLLAIVNIVGDYAGDVILPGEGLLSFGGGGSGGLGMVENENEAIIENTIVASADTGNNVVEDSDEAAVVTGDAVAAAESETVVNTNFVGDNWLLVVVNVFGEWLGDIVDGEDQDGDGVIGFLFGGGEEGGTGCETGCGDIVSISGKNVASIRNTVTATANTGGNSITGADDAAITTGDATAVAAAFNFVNNNVVGSNWLFGIVNVFGRWSGDLAFAYPDLSTSVSDGRDTALPGDMLEYGVRVENGGKADAENVKVSFRIPDASEFRFASDGAHRDGDTVFWMIDDLKKGFGKGFSVKVFVREDVSDGEDLRAYAQAETGTTEKHPEDNVSDDSTRIDIPDTRITGFDADDDPYHTGLRVRRSKPEGTHRGGESITHWITVENTGKHEAREVVVSDAFETPDGTIIATPLWLVGDIRAGKGVRIEYTIVIPAEVGAGQYRYIAKADGRQRDDEEIESKKAYAILTIAGSAFASTFGAETVDAASPEGLSVPGEVRGAEASTIGDIAGKKGLPLWMLLLSGVAYGLMLNWSFFPSISRRTTDI